MCWCIKVIFVMIIIYGLDAIQNEDEEQEENFGDCFLVNPSVKAIRNQLGNIRLNISWSGFQIGAGRNSTINLFTNAENCFQTETEEYLQALKGAYTIEPNLDSTDPEILYGCNYNISLKNEDRQLCEMNYVIPRCVDQECGCETIQEPKILDIRSLKNDSFAVKWDPGLYNEDEPIKVMFEYSPDSFNFVPVYSDNNMTANISIITIPGITKGDNYTLIAHFEFLNNCSTPPESPKLPFSVPLPKHEVSRIIIVITVINVVLLLALVLFVRKPLSKYYKKMLNLLSRTPPETIATVTYDKVGMQNNRAYITSDHEAKFEEIEIPRHKIILKEMIGQGAFGEVRSAKAFGINGCPDDDYRMVAVKTLGEGVTEETIADFLSEIEIFRKIGYHQNIVRLLGCCTVGTPVMMIMELVPCGDLKSYLLDLREKWSKTNKRIFFDTSGGPCLDPESPTSPVSTTSNSFLLTTPSSADPKTPLIANYQESLERVLDHTELHSFALQVARGMSHLEKIGITHRDLAARNILINENKELKISDFGLSRKGPYIINKRRKLPLRWMAIEAITDPRHTYNSKTDVWSFGVLLWEIGTLGALPYEKVPDKFLQQFLEMENRLQRPEVCTDELYELMLRCWCSNPSERPSFEEVVYSLDQTRMYVDFCQLNPSYVFPPTDSSLV